LSDRIVQRATAQSKTGIFRGYGVAEALSGSQAGWSDCMFFSFLSFCSFCCEIKLTYALKKPRFYPVLIISMPLRAKE
jgi:hypothetical protein